MHGIGKLLGWFLLWACALVTCDKDFPAKYRLERKQAMIDAALAYARLAPLPVPAEQAQASTEGLLFSRQIFLSFKTTPEKISRWIEASPSLRDNEPFLHNANHMYISNDELEKRSERDQYGHEPFWIPPNAKWFDPSIREKGRRFEIPQDKSAYSGTVIIDDITDTVYILAAYS